jgi:hypothetical protein
MSTTKKVEIPPVSAGARFLEAVRTNMEIIMGRRGGAVDPVDTTGMSGNDLVLAEKLNEIIARLQ